MRHVLALVLAASSLAGQKPPELRRLAAIPVGVGVVTHVAVHPSGTLAAVSTADGEVLGVDPVSRRIVHRWRPPSWPVARLQFASDGSLHLLLPDVRGTDPDRQTWALAAADGSGGIRRWGVTVAPSQEGVAAWREAFGAGHDFYGSDLAEVSASADRRVCVALWNRGWVQVWRQGEVRALLDTGAPPTILTQDGRWAVSKLPTRLVAHPIDRGVPYELAVDGNEVWALAAGADGCDFAVITAREVVLHHAASRRELRRIPLPARNGRPLPVREAATSPRTGVLAVRGWYEGNHPAVALCDLATGRWREHFCHHGSMSWTSDGRTLLVGTGRYGCCLWERDLVRAFGLHAEAGEEIPLPAGTMGNDFAVGAVPGKRWLVAAGSQAVCVDRSGRPVGAPVPQLPSDRLLPLSPRWLLVAEPQGVQLRSLPDLTERSSQPSARSVHDLAAAPAGNRFVLVEDGLLEVFAVGASGRRGGS